VSLCPLQNPPEPWHGNVIEQLSPSDSATSKARNMRSWSGGGLGCSGTPGYDVSGGPQIQDLAPSSTSTHIVPPALLLIRAGSMLPFCKKRTHKGFPYSDGPGSLHRIVAI